jgi:hypothetical protein
LEFRQGNISLDTTGVKVQMDLLNSAVNDGFLTGSYSQEWVAPFSPTNDKFFKFARYIDTRKKQRKFENIEFRFKGNPYLKGFLLLKKISPKGYHCTFSINGFISSVLDVSLQNINYGPDIDMGFSHDTVLAYAKERCAESYPQTSHVFPCLDNPGFYGQENPQFGGIINNYDQTQQKFYKNNATNFYNYNSLVPFFFVHFIIQKISKHLNYAFSGSFFTDEKLKQLLIYNNTATDKKIGKHRFTHVQRNEDQNYNGTHWQKIWMSRVEDLDNCWDTTNHGYQMQTNGSIYEAEAKVNFVRFATGSAWVALTVFNYNTNTREILDEYEFKNIDQGEITLKASYEYSGQWEHIRIEIRGAFTDPGKITKAELQVNDIKASALNVHDRKIKISDHVPDITIGEFFQGLREILPLDFKFDFKQRNVDINFQPDILKTIAVDYTTKVSRKYRVNQEFDLQTEEGFTQTFEWGDDALAADLKPIPKIDITVNRFQELPSALGNIGKFALVRSLNLIYQSVISEISSSQAWLPYTYNYTPNIIGSGKKELKSRFAPMLMKFVKDGIFPAIVQQGTSAVFNLQNEPPLRLFFWHGMRQGRQGLYPFASSLNYSYTAEISELAITWPSLNQYYWGQWLQVLLNAETLKEKLMLNENDLGAINHSCKVRIENCEYIIKSIKILLENDDIRLSEGEFIKINL